MLNNYTAAKRKRHQDDFAPGGVGGGRPNRAVVVYSQVLRRLFPKVPIILGGIEASLRRLVHYDYWEDALRNSILTDAQADLLIYGMGEKAMLQVALGMQQGKTLAELQPVAGTAYLASQIPPNAVLLPSLEEMRQEKALFAEGYRLATWEENPYLGKPVAQAAGRQWVIINPPSLPLSSQEMDSVYELPYTRKWHPSYEALGGVPALKEVEFSITSHRGCFGGCSFCALSAHQGRIIQSRTPESILQEAKDLTSLPGFKGYIHDLSGPSANFRQVACSWQHTRGACRERQCLAPTPCPKLQVDHQPYLELLRSLRRLPGVKRVFIRSGLRFDYLLMDKNFRRHLQELCQYHISGQLKVAPEHVAAKVTHVMGKPPLKVYEKFRLAYQEVNAELGKKQYLVPYFISSHPGCGLTEAIELAEYLRDVRYTPEQVQDFIPTPGSLSTAIYYSGVHPYSGEKVMVVKNAEQRRMQRALLQYRLPQNRSIVLKALRLAGREDLIGRGGKTLVSHVEGRRERG